MKIDQRDQAEIACRYLEYTSDVEIGVEGVRELTKYEEDVRSTALSCLLVYFLKDFDTRVKRTKKATATRPKQAKEKKLSRKS